MAEARSKLLQVAQFHFLFYLQARMSVFMANIFLFWFHVSLYLRSQNMDVSRVNVFHIESGSAT